MKFRVKCQLDFWADDAFVDESPRGNGWILVTNEGQEVFSERLRNASPGDLESTWMAALDAMQAVDSQVTKNIARGAVHGTEKSAYTRIAEGCKRVQANPPTQGTTTKKTGPRSKPRPGLEGGAMQSSTPAGDSARRVHEDQSRRVAASVMGDSGGDVYHRRRLVGGVAAAAIRDSVRDAITVALKSPTMTHAEVANVGALAAERALAHVGFSVYKIGSEREGWREQLAHIELLVHEGTDASLAQASVEVQSLIDSVHEV